MKITWWIKDIALSSYPEAQPSSHLLNAEFDAPRILVPARKTLDSLFEPFELVRFSSDNAWLSLRWQSRILCDENAKWRYGKVGMLLNVEGLSTLELEAESWAKGELLQTWFVRIAVDPHRVPLKEVIVGKHPKMATKTLWFFMWEGIDEECFQLHMSHLKKYMSFFDNIIVSLALNSWENEWRVKGKVANMLGYHHCIEFVSGLNNKTFRKVPHFLSVLQSHMGKMGDIVLYVHSKRAQDKYAEAWIELMYKFCVANWDTMMSHPSIHQGGALTSSKALSKSSSNWHYTGAFVWYRNYVLPELTSFVERSSRWGVEKLSGYLDPLGSRSLCFHREIAHLPNQQNAQLMRDFWRDSKAILDVEFAEEKIKPKRPRNILKTQV